MTSFRSRFRLTDLVAGFRYGFRHFYTGYIIAVVQFILAVALVNGHLGKETEAVLLKFLMVGFMALPVAVGLHLLAHRLGHHWPRWLPMLVVLVYPVWGLFYPDHLTRFDIIQLFMLIVLGHLFVAFAPYIKTQDGLGFWQFNRHLFLRFATTVLYSVVLTVGLEAAVGTVQLLLYKDLSHNTYAYLAAFIGLVFNTWFFLSAVPVEFEEVAQETSYPKGLRVFTQYVLVPLVLIYLAILYAYGIKILINQTLPNGYVSILSLSFSTVGILALLLVWPLRLVPEYAQIRTFARWFFLGLIPVLALLYTGIGKRIYDYGITEPRYIVLALAIWLTVITVYFLLSHQKDIRYIPITLALVAFFAAVGPLNAFHVTSRSQYGLLVEELNRLKLLDENGKIKKNNTLKNEDYDRLEALFLYFNTSDRGQLLEPLMPYKPSTETRWDSSTFISYGSVMDSLNLKRANDSLTITRDEYGNEIRRGGKNLKYRSFSNDTLSFDVTGFNHLVMISSGDSTAFPGGRINKGVIYAGSDSLDINPWSRRMVNRYATEDEESVYPAPLDTAVGGHKFRIYLTEGRLGMYEPEGYYQAKVLVGNR